MRRGSESSLDEWYQQAHNGLKERRQRESLRGDPYRNPPSHFENKLDRQRIDRRVEASRQIREIIDRQTADGS